MNQLSECVACNLIMRVMKGKGVSSHFYNMIHSCSMNHLKCGFRFFHILTSLPQTIISLIDFPIAFN